MRNVVNVIASFATEVTAAASKVVLEAIRDRLPSALASDRLKVDGSGVTQPVSGTVQTSPALGTSYSSPAAEASKAFNSPQIPVKGRMFNGNAGVRYFQWFNATSLPANGAIPVSEQVCAANGTGEIVFPIPTDRFSTGLVGATSSTAPTLTIGSADALFWFYFYPQA